MGAFLDFLFGPTRVKPDIEHSARSTPEACPQCGGSGVLTEFDHHGHEVTESCTICGGTGSMDV